MPAGLARGCPVLWLTMCPPRWTAACRADRTSSHASTQHAGEEGKVPYLLSFFLFFFFSLWAVTVILSIRYLIRLATSTCLPPSRRTQKPPEREGIATSKRKGVRCRLINTTQEGRHADHMLGFAGDQWHAAMPTARALLLGRCSPAEPAGEHTLHDRPTLFVLSSCGAGIAGWLLSHAVSKPVVARGNGRKGCHTEHAWRETGRAEAETREERYVLCVRRS